MFAGPIFAREALIAPRRLSHYLLRSGYVACLLVLMYTIRQATIGFQDTKFSGDIAAYSSLVFSVFALLQLTLGMFFATLFTAANIAQEKDRRTLILLLMTDMRSRELALGKLLASLLIVGVLLAASLPVFCVLQLLGGVSWSQILWAEAIIAATTLASGSWGCMVAYWREKTFQTLAISVLGVVLFVASVEGVIALVGSQSTVGFWLGQLSPYRSLFSVLNPLTGQDHGVVLVSALKSVSLLTGLAAALSLYTIKRLRIWNPSQQLRQSVLENESQPSAVAPDSVETTVSTGKGRKHHRAVWNNPVTWKEIATRGYGQKIVVIKLAYVLLAALIGYSVMTSRTDSTALVLGMISPPAAAFLAIAVISLLLINAQAVTSISTERDDNTLDILLATDLHASEFMTG
ncbi:MAG: ABC transporter permease subunit, partial [Fuerstiella sp.]